MATIDREDLVQFAKRRHTEVPFLQTGKKVRIQSLTERERAELESAIVERKGGSLRARIIAKSVVDEDGKRIFSDDDIPFIESLDSQVTSELYDAIDQHCGVIRGQDDLETIGKNSEEIPEDDSR